MKERKRVATLVEDGVLLVSLLLVGCIARTNYNPPRATRPDKSTTEDAATELDTDAGTAPSTCSSFEVSAAVCTGVCQGQCAGGRCALPEGIGCAGKCDGRCTGVCVECD